MFFAADSFSFGSKESEKIMIVKMIE